MFSLIIPLDPNRLELFMVTKRRYDHMPQKKEFIIPTRNELKVARFLDDHNLIKDVRLFPYKVDKGFNVSRALNIGVRNARSNNIVITSPEVKPNTDVLAQFEELKGKNVLANVADQDENGNITPLVHDGYRDESPAMYFLALFNKKDIETINGWDEQFMEGYAYEDDDFGARWNRAGLPFEFHPEIMATHQYHPRVETIAGGLASNHARFQDNNANNVIKCTLGLKVLR